MLVYDLGGGTFDVSIVQAQEGVVEVLSSHGDTQLGGDDFDDLLLKTVCDRFQAEHGIDLRATPVSKARVLRAVEAAKRQLSFHPFARLEEEFIAEKASQPLHLDLEINRHEYEELIRPLLDRTMDCVQKALDDAKVTAAMIDKVVLVGGATRTPLVTALLEGRLNQPAHQEVNPDLCVAMGAAIQGGIIAGQSVGAVLVDITPHTLGIDCLQEGPMGQMLPFRFAPIIHRGTPLPASRSDVFFTHYDEQTVVEMGVYQGENEDVRHNFKVGELVIEGLARVPSGNALTVQFDLNLDGVLRVSAKERATGLQKQATIANALTRARAAEGEQARERLRRLWSQGEEEGEDEGPAQLELAPGPGDGHRETVQARALLEKAERLLPKAPAEDRGEIERLMGNVRTNMAERKWEQLTRASNELADVLFYLEDA
jgi:molecular chaperone DnaK